MRVPYVLACVTMVLAGCSGAVEADRSADPSAELATAESCSTLAAQNALLSAQVLASTNQDEAARLYAQLAAAYDAAANVVAEPAAAAAFREQATSLRQTAMAVRAGVPPDLHAVRRAGRALAEVC